jgi:putative transposase
LVLLRQRHADRQPQVAHILDIVDDFTGGALSWLPTLRSLSGEGGPGTGYGFRQYGKPLMIVSDTGTEFTSTAILSWSQHTRIEWHYIAPGKPQQNAFVESFNGRLRNELLNETLFSSLDHARSLLADWQDEYTRFDRQSAAGNLRKLTASDMQWIGTLRYVEGSAPRPIVSPSHTGSNDPRALPIAG